MIVLLWSVTVSNTTASVADLEAAVEARIMA